MIPVQNIYYMLSYAFQILQEQGYRQVAAESFQNTADLCAAILEKGISRQLKQGLGREYLPQTEPLTLLRGKIELAESIKQQTLRQQRLVCTYDDFSVNTPMNRVLKSTLLLLLRADISKERKKTLRKLLVYFGDVDPLDLHTIQWNFHFHRGNQTYRMLLAVCWLVIKGLLQTQSDGTTRLMDFLDEQRMCRLYEKFLLAYYQKHFPELNASASQIAWELEDDEDSFLPVMQSDIMLSKGNRVLILDAKYYSSTTQQHYGVHTLHSANLYQMFTYVKNKDSSFGDAEHQVAGLLLYARTDEEFQLPERTYRMSGNEIGVRTIDLNCDFAEIRRQLDAIAAAYFPQT